MIDDRLRLDHPVQLVDAVEEWIPKKLAKILGQVASECLFFQRFYRELDFCFVKISVNRL